MFRVEPVSVDYSVEEAEEIDVDDNQQEPHDAHLP
jgi:hypothetical protein